MSYRAGYVALVGKPNVGKSTFLNHVVGQKVSIVSAKPQTTRRKVLGIVTTDEYQIAFVDTPGIHNPNSQLGKSMIDQARLALDGVDAVLFVVDGAHHPGEQDREVAGLLARDLRDREVPVVLAMNKMDQLKAENVQRFVDAYTELARTDEYMLMRANTGTNLDKVLDILVQHLPERPPIFPPDEFTDQSSRFMAAELVREKILIATRQEVPHSSAVSIDSWTEEDDLTRIEATILVEKDSQRAILIGKGGQFIKNIGSRARPEIEELIGGKVFLQLHVKVSPGWRMNPRVLHELEYDS